YSPRDHRPPRAYGLHLSGSNRVRRLGGMDIPRWSIFLFHHAINYRFRRFGSWKIFPKSGYAKWTASTGGLLCLSSSRTRAYSYVFYFGARRSHSEVQTNSSFYWNIKTHTRAG
ncbi:hypothetical protein L9F63_010827, partial [Diploptera punctata]